MSTENPVREDIALALGSDYDIVRELGRGGASVVYLARDRVLEREVAIKVIRDPQTGDAEAIARFEREARTLAALQHPNIVMLYGARPLPGGTLALVMQHGDWNTLKNVIRERGPLPSETVEQVLCDVASALHYLHRHHVIHRDIKPENIFIEKESGRALLSDFGIAKSGDGRSSVTLTGVVIGTPAYMSPEQIDGGELTGRSDLYSLGMVGYEMLTGIRPWDGESLFGVIYKQKTEKLPQLRTQRPDVPVELIELIEKATEKSPADRWQSAQEIITALTGDTPSNTGEFRRPAASLPAVTQKLDPASQTWPRAVPAPMPAPMPAPAPAPVQAPAHLPVAPAAAAVAVPPPVANVDTFGSLEYEKAMLDRAIEERHRIRNRKMQWAAAITVVLLGSGAVGALANWRNNDPAPESLLDQVNNAYAMNDAARPEGAPELPAEPANATPAGDTERSALTNDANREEAATQRPTGETTRLRQAEQPPANVISASESAQGANGNAVQTVEPPAAQPSAPVSIVPELRIARTRSTSPRVAASTVLDEARTETNRAPAPKLRNLPRIEQLMVERYPQELRTRNIGGQVLLQVLVAPDGRVVNQRVVSTSGNPKLDEAALYIAERMMFDQPAGITPQAQWVPVPLDFRPRDDENENP